MRVGLLEILACPDCGGGLSLESSEIDRSGDVLTGSLNCQACHSTYPIRAGIPRFVESHDADASFGHQWNLFRREQLDSSNGAGLSAKRLWSETGWSPRELIGKRVLDVGCGAGRFLEVVSEADCEVVGVDVSNAIDASATTVHGRKNVHLVQADVYKLPFRSGTFDACYFIGVAQHTPAPLKALAGLPRMLRPGGQIAISAYARNRWTSLNGKYLLRPLTRRMNKRLLLSSINGLMPVLFPLTEVLFRLPLVGKAFGFVIPVANYVHMRDLSWRQRYRIALLDTFDRLAPKYDGPLTEDEVRTTLTEAGIEGLRRPQPAGVNLVGHMRIDPARS